MACTIASRRPHRAPVAMTQCAARPALVEQRAARRPGSRGAAESVHRRVRSRSPADVAPATAISPAPEWALFTAGGRVLTLHELAGSRPRLPGSTRGDRGRHARRDPGLAPSARPTSRQHPPRRALGLDAAALDRRSRAPGRETLQSPFGVPAIPAVAPVLTATLARGQLRAGRERKRAEEGRACVPVLADLYDVRNWSRIGRPAEGPDLPDSAERRPPWGLAFRLDALLRMIALFDCAKSNRASGPAPAGCGRRGEFRRLSLRFVAPSPSLSTAFRAGRPD